MAGVVPLKSSNVSFAIRVSPDRLFFTLVSLTLVIIPPSTTSVFSGIDGNCIARWLASA